MNNTNSSPAVEIVGEVTLSIPAGPRFIRLARLTAASYATEVGFNVESIEDLRIGVDEACTALIAGEHSGEIKMRFKSFNGDVIVEAERTEHRSEASELDEFVEAILDATLDSYLFETEPHRFRLMKSNGE